MLKGRLQSPNMSFEGMSTSLSVLYLLRYHHTLILPICLRHQSWYSYCRFALIAFQENQCRTRKICGDRFKRQNGAFVVSPGWSAVQSLGRSVLSDAAHEGRPVTIIGFERSFSIQAASICSLLQTTRL